MGYFIGLILGGISVAVVVLSITLKPDEAGAGLIKPTPPVVYEYPEFNTVCFAKTGAVSCVKVKRGDNP